MRLSSNDWAITKTKISKFSFLFPLFHLIYATSAQIFHELINTEETRMRVDIRQYDLHGIYITMENGLYKIQVPGLAEKRPSVLRGDLVRAKLHQSYDDTMYPSPLLNIICFEHISYDGFAHFVNLEDVRVSFHSNIHPLVESGMPFDVQFTFSRTPIKHYHRALDIKTDFWQKLWAPSKPAAPSGTLSRVFGKVPLNKEQIAATLTVLQNQIAPIILQGPPGTGKLLF